MAGEGSDDRICQWWLEKVETREGRNEAVVAGKVSDDMRRQ